MARYSRNNLSQKVNIGGSQYKYVRKKLNEITNKVYYAAEVSKVSNIKHYSIHETEREAAIAVDKAFIQNGKDPVNILKRKSA